MSSLRSFLLLSFATIALLRLSAQTLSTDKRATFTPPFDFPITFAGNFGELRANHFHGGLDFKTGGVEGKRVRALADGYVSRISVTHGSGYVLYVAYDNGFTAINRHLSAFLSPIAERVEALQYERENWEVEIIPEPGEYPVKQGEVIALSGNTGYSFGPHLHLDIFETDSGDFVDPLPFFKEYVKDRVAPRAEKIILFPQVGRGVVDGNTSPLSFSTSSKKTVTAWGVIGAGICAYDYMDGVRNKYGVYSVLLEVDGQEVFHSLVNRFASRENRFINSWTYKNYMKSFIDPGNRLRMLQAANGNRGLITIDEERPYHFVYTLSDAFGNSSKVEFTVQGKCMDVPPMEHREKYIFHQNQINYLQEPGLQLVVPKGMLYNDAYLNYAVRADSGDIAFTYQLNDTRIPLHEGCELRIGLRRRLPVENKKYYVAKVGADGRKQSVGGIFEDGFVKARIYDLATYTVGVDTLPPRITPLAQAEWGRRGRILFKVEEKETQISSYHGKIDGKYALFGIPNSISGNLVCQLDAKRVEKGRPHKVEITVTDDCGNSVTETYGFVW